jgi:hypothetical protein
MMDDSYTNYVKDMERGSQMLLAAINAARAGTCPATPVRALRLPPDWNKRERERQLISERRTSPKDNPIFDYTRARIMLREGYTIRDIAAALKCSHQKATAMVKAVKEQKPADDDLRGKLWG